MLQNIDSPFCFIQNEDFSDEGDETEQGGEDTGSACPRGPRGPVGPPGIEVGSKNLVTQCLHITPTLSVKLALAQPPWCWSASTPASIRFSKSFTANQHPNLILPNPNLRVPAGDGGISEPLVSQRRINGPHLAPT